MGKIDQGKAFEYSCITELANAIRLRDCGILPVVDLNSSYLVAQSNFKLLQSKQPAHAIELTEAASKLAEILFLTEPKLTNLESNASSQILLALQSDIVGIRGDVRDIVAIRSALRSNFSWEIGVSCKHNHDAVKHPRISPTIDFGANWLGYRLDNSDFSKLNAIFSQIDEERKNGVTAWSEVQSKESRYYLPVLQLVMDKINSHPDKASLAEHLLNYLIGNRDFYKVIYNRNRTIHLQGFNFSGTLNKSSLHVNPALTVNKLHFPSRIISLDFKPGSKNTIEVFFDKGWQVSLRVHSAATKIEKSLKMDVRLDGTPSELFNYSQNI